MAVRGGMSRESGGGAAGAGVAALSLPVFELVIFLQQPGCWRVWAPSYPFDRPQAPRHVEARRRQAGSSFSAQSGCRDMIPVPFRPPNPAVSPSVKQMEAVSPMRSERLSRNGFQMPECFPDDLPTFWNPGLLLCPLPGMPRPPSPPSKIWPVKVPFAGVHSSAGPPSYLTHLPRAPTVAVSLSLECAFCCPEALWSLVLPIDQGRWVTSDSHLGPKLLCMGRGPQEASENRYRMKHINWNTETQIHTALFTDRPGQSW